MSVAFSSLTADYILMNYGIEIDGDLEEGHRLFFVTKTNHEGRVIGDKRFYGV